LTITLDATYSVGDKLSGVGVYSRELLYGLARAYPSDRFTFCYRPHRFLRAWREPKPPNVRTRLLGDRWLTPARADLFHGLNQRLPQGRLRRAVTTFHDLFVLTGDYSTAEFRTRFAAQARDAAARSDLIISVSAFTAVQVEALLGVPAARIRVVPHGVHWPAAEPALPREDTILHVGAIQKRKNVVRLVEAFEQIGPPWRLVLAGSHGFGAEEILARIAGSSARSRIEVTGYVGAATLDRLYRTARVFAFPSLDEGFGIPLLEAMAHGIPILTSNCSALCEVAGDAALLVDPTDSDAIRSGLDRLCHDEGLRRSLLERGYARASRYPWTAAVQQTWNVYRELLA
jgi:glycosyltransferase involved in cell wall biosynthesis